MLDKLGYIAAGLGMASIGASIGAWYKEKSNDEAENAHAERTGIYVGLWPASFFGLSLLFFKMKEMGHERDLKRLTSELDKRLKELNPK